MADVTPSVAGYSDLSEVGRGGFSRVYRANQDRFKRLVALKVLSLADPDERTRHRFERECQAMGELSWHPNVVAVYDSGLTDDGRLWLSMEYLEAGSLADRLATGQTLDWQDALTTAIEVTGALGAAHAAGTLHRDLKPENLLVGPFGEIRLADFGIAAVEGSQRTTTGVASFTVAHVAPEVLRGQRPDERTDLYGLASALYTLIVGTPPFSADHDEPIAAVMMRVVDTAAPRLPLPAPADLADLVGRTLAKDPAERPTSATDLGEALQAVQRAHGLTVTPLRLSPTTAGTPVVPAAATAPVVGPDQSTIVTGPGLRTAPPTGGAGGDVQQTVNVTAPALPPPPPAAPPATAASDRRRWLLVLVPVAVIALLIGAFVLTRGGGDDIVSGGTTVDIGENPNGVAIGPEFVRSSPGDSNEVSRVDPATDEEVTSTDIGTPAVGVAITADSATWLAHATDRSVTRIDIDTDIITNLVEVGDNLTSVSAVNDLVWVTLGNGGGAGELALIESLEVTSLIDVGSSPNIVSATADVVWVANHDGTVTRVDPDTATITSEIDVGGTPAGIAATDLDVWVTASPSDGVVTRIDAGTNEVVDTVDVGESPHGIAATVDAVWVANTEDDTVSRIDPATNEVTDTIGVGDAPVAVAATNDQVWVANSGDGTLTRIDPADFG